MMKLKTKELLYVKLSNVRKKTRVAKAGKATKKKNRMLLLPRSVLRGRWSECAHTYAWGTFTNHQSSLHPYEQQPLDEWDQPNKCT
jgi:hypothetical protein